MVSMDDRFYVLLCVCLYQLFGLECIDGGSGEAKQSTSPQCIDDGCCGAPLGKQSVVGAFVDAIDDQTQQHGTSDRPLFAENEPIQSADQEHVGQEEPDLFGTNGRSLHIDQLSGQHGKVEPHVRQVQQNKKNRRHHQHTYLCEIHPVWYDICYRYIIIYVFVPYAFVPYAFVPYAFVPYAFVPYAFMMPSS